MWMGVRYQACIALRVLFVRWSRPHHEDGFPVSQTAKPCLQSLLCHGDIRAAVSWSWLMSKSQARISLCSLGWPQTKANNPLALASWIYRHEPWLACSVPFWPPFPCKLFVFRMKMDVMAAHVPGRGRGGSRWREHSGVWKQGVLEE